MLLLLVFVFSAHALEKYVEDRTCCDTGWIRIALGAGETIKRVQWCKSIVSDTDVDECRGRNLMRMQLFPSVQPYIHMSEREPNVIYIDPNDLGGPDLTHQFDILVETLNPETLRVLRYNRAVQTTATEEDTFTTEAPVTTEVTTEAPLTTAEETFTTEAAHLTEAPTLSTPTVHPWLAVLITFTIGICVILVTALAYTQRAVREDQRHTDARLAVQREEMNARIYGGVQYQFEIADDGHKTEIASESDDKK